MKAAIEEGIATCHVSASIAKETAARNGRMWRLERFSDASERVFRNEFPYFGHVGWAAWASSRLVGGNRSGSSPCLRCARAGSGPRRTEGATEGGCAEGSGRACADCPGARSRCARCRSPTGPGPASGTADSADLCAVDEVLPEGPGRQRQAGLL